MKILIVEDDFTSRLLLQELLQNYGVVHIAVNGKEACEAVKIALDAGKPYDVICLDIMMPEMDGQWALREIRAQETSRGMPPATWSKIIMATALEDPGNVIASFKGLCDAYLTKPIKRAALLAELRKLKLIS